MRVLLVGDFPPPHGGISVHLAGLASVLGRQGFVVQVLDVSRPAKRSAPANVTAARGRLHVARIIARAASRGHLVHVHVSGHNAPSWSLATAATWLSRPFGRSLITVHSGLAPAYLSGPGPRWRARLACSTAARVLCANEDIERALRRCDVRPGRLETLPAFIDEPGPPGAPPASFAALRRSCDRLLLVALGDEPVYGAPLFLETVERLAPGCAGLGVCAIGRGADAALAGRLRGLLGERALVLGEVGHPEALAILAQTDVFLRPTLADGDSVSVREAISGGAAVVATSVSPRPPGVLLAAVDPVELADATRRALEAGRPGRPPTVASAHRRLLELYGALLAPPPGLAPAHQTP